MTISADLATVGTATIAEAWKTARIMHDPPRPLVSGMSLAGAALTVRCKPGDNLALHRAIAEAPYDGSMLFVDYSGCITSSPFGEIMALACQVRGIVGLIIDGSVRDSLQIADMEFPVFARGKNIRGTEKKDNGVLNIPLEIGGILIQPGEMVVADADGVVVFPFHDAENVLDVARKRIKNETSVMARLRAGETTIQIFKLET